MKFEITTEYLHLLYANYCLDAESEDIGIMPYEEWLEQEIVEREKNHQYELTSFQAKIAELENRLSA